MIHNRAMLLETISEMNLSPSTREKIRKLFPKLGGKETEKLENLAKEVWAVLKSCKNEEEVLRKMAEKYPEFE